jgi:beta-exotoxin I transport system ATP-binding protein
MATPAIECAGLTKFYGPRRGIEDIDLQVRQGEVFGFLGPNGAGKTTMIRLLLDLLRPTRGNAFVLGRDCRRKSRAVRRSIGYLPGEYHLYENITGLEALRFLSEVGGTFEAGLVEELAERLGADLHRPIRTLSHGNKQKLAIVLAFQEQAPLLVLDEPTTGLDPLVQQEFFAMIEEVRQDGRTVFLSSHNLTEVERVCDRVAMIESGKLIAIEEVAAIGRQALRLVKISCVRPPAPDVFDDLDGVDELSIEGCTVRCKASGALGPLLQRASAFGIEDLLSREPSLEEFFLSRYGARRSPNAR